MPITLGDAFQNWNPTTRLAAGATVDGGVISMLEANLFRNRVMIPGVTFSTDVESLMVDNHFAVAFIRRLDKIKVSMCEASAQNAFRVEATEADGSMIEIKCNDVLKVGEVVHETIDKARVSGKTADKVALASECYEEIKELRYLSYLINGGRSNDPTDVGAPASANIERCTRENVLDCIIDDRKVIRQAGAEPDTLLISDDTDALFLKRLSERTYFAVASAAESNVLGQVYAGTLFSGQVKVFTSNALGQDNSVLVGKTAGDEEWDWTNIEYILYDHRALSIVNIARFIGLVDYSSHEYNSSLIAIFTVCGGRIRNHKKVIAKKYALPKSENAQDSKSNDDAATGGKATE